MRSDAIDPKPIVAPIDNVPSAAINSTFRVPDPMPNDTVLGWFTHAVIGEGLDAWKWRAALRRHGGAVR
jgi:hypothetical protein